MLYTSHNMHEMEEMSDRIVFLQRGKIVAEGTAQEIVERFGQGGFRGSVCEVSAGEVGGRRWEGSLASGARTIGMCSLDGRSGNPIPNASLNGCLLIRREGREEKDEAASDLCVGG